MIESFPRAAMTSSELEPDPPPQPPTGAGAQPQPVLASGHLHPGMLFLRFLDGLRGTLVPLIIAIVAQLPLLGALVAGWFVLSMVYALVRYLTFEYVLTSTELVTREGILHRQERRIPVDRVQDLSFESTLVRRIFGLVVVSVETASGSGAEARLDSLGRFVRSSCAKRCSRCAVGRAPSAARRPRRRLARWITCCLSPAVVSWPCAV